MDGIGAFGRALFTALYDFRIPLGVGSVVVAALFLSIAWRRGWSVAVRRHPRVSAAVLVAAIVLGAPAGWYLASPIWIRTSLVEEEPDLALADVVPTIPAPSVAPAVPTAPPSQRASPSSSAAASGPRTIATGRFAGTDDFHFGHGTASLIQIAPGRFHLRLDDFSVRNGPDLYVYLSTAADGFADDALELGRLKATDGSFGYDLPAQADPAIYRSAIIWCKQFSHLFAVARLAV